MFLKNNDIFTIHKLKEHMAILMNLRNQLSKNIKENVILSS